MLGNLVALAILGFAIFGGYTIWKMQKVQDSVSSVERAAKAAKTAW